ncbi:type II secretion system F family protein [bacterium]|nr:type II secretion system F family protein [bacterium]
MAVAKLNTTKLANFFRPERRVALERMVALKDTQNSNPAVKPVVLVKDKANESAEPLREEIPDRGLKLSLYQAKLSINPLAFRSLAALIAAVVVFFTSKILSFYVIPLIAYGAYTLPFSYLRNRAQKRAAQFNEDYPTVLMAMASSLKVGMNPYMALERAVKLLQKTSPIRVEVERLLLELRKGTSREEAVRYFAADIALPDLDLFRAAFLLVLENGGRFAPTLQRLAQVSRDRETLTSSALVSTTTMRMTANILLLVTPFVVGMIAVRTKDFWEIILHHPVANGMATAGVLIIIVGYAALRRMSDFRP